MKEFSEDQVKEIIRKAAEMQKKSTISSSESGLTMDELLEIGKDSGLEETFIKTAALELENQHITQHSDLTDTHIFEEHTFKTKLNEDVIWEEVTSELSHHFGGNAFGRTKYFGGEKKWSHQSISGIETIASLKLHDNIAKLKFSQRVGLGAPLTEGISYGAFLTFLIMVVVVPVSGISLSEIIALGTGIWSISSVLIYRLDVIWRKKKLRNLKSLVHKIVSQLPKKDATKGKKRGTLEGTSSIEIESENVYQSEENLKNSLREKE